MRRTKIKDVLAGAEAGGEVVVQGWVKTRRSSKAVSFLQINDGSTLRDLQVVVDRGLPIHEAAESLGTGASVRVSGDLMESPGKGQTYEVHAKDHGGSGGRRP